MYCISKYLNEQFPYCRGYSICWFCASLCSLPENLHIVSQVRVNYGECREVSQELSHQQVPDLSSKSKTKVGSSWVKGNWQLIVAVGSIPL